MRAVAGPSCLLLALAGCVGPDAMRGLSPESGVEIHYAVSSDSLLSALPGALTGRHLHVVVREPQDSLTTMVIARKGTNLLTYGELIRVLVQPDAAGDGTMARFVARSQSALDHSGRVDRVVPRVIQALDDSLGAAALGPFVGMRLRGRVGGSAGLWVDGALSDGPDGVLGINANPAVPDEFVPLATLRDVAVFRGSYSHRSEGALIGSIVGMLAGAIIGSAAASDSFDRPNSASLGFLIGSTVGVLAGVGIGASIRTEVWSEIGTPTTPPATAPPQSSHID